jgi:Holliday junction DNA helicase, RuvA subunit
MIRRLRGAVVECAGGELILDVGGVGYQVFIAETALESLPAKGETATLFISTHVREDAIQLYGFPRREELRMFETLLGVGGIGPRLALTILSHMSPEALASAVMAGDERALTKIPGIGKKTAARMLLELRDRIKEFHGMGEAESPRQHKALPADHRVDDALAALLALGFGEDDATAALREALSEESGTGDVQGLIKAALKRLDTRK